MDKKRLTSENGKPIADNQNIQTADVRGPPCCKTYGISKNSPISTGK